MTPASSPPPPCASPHIGGTVERGVPSRSTAVEVQHPTLASPRSTVRSSVCAMLGSPRFAPDAGAFDTGASPPQTPLVWVLVHG